MRIILRWQDSDRAAWESAFVQVMKSNILQSWSYGEAKAATEHVTPKRAIIFSNERAIGVVQALQRSIAGIGHVMRINRGPLWFAAPERNVVEAVLAELRRSARWWQGNVLFIAPELSQDADSLRVMKLLGFHMRRAPAWRSAWVDLTTSEDTLRRSLDGKWRNMVVAGERAGITTTVEQSTSAFEWVLERYSELRKERDFSGPSLAFLRAWWFDQAKTQRSFIIRAWVEDACVAGQIIALHGRSATYLLGVASNDGKQHKKAGNLLLWSAIQASRDRDCTWFDVGGIDDVNTPGIARFKRGLNGAEYCLAGEFIGI